MKIESKDRVYKLVRGMAPLSFTLATTSSSRRPLLYFDNEKGYNRQLRYARNQKSPFEDEQDGNAIVEPIIFENGMLRVPKENPVLQEFLHYHPANGKKFVEVDAVKEAQVEVDEMNQEIDALIEAKNLSIEQLETLGAVLFSKDVSTVPTAELRRDMLVFAKNNPEVFLRSLSDPNMKLLATIQKFFDQKLLAYRNNKKDVHFNLAKNKKRMAVVPYGADPIEYLSEWFITDEGVEVLEFLEKQL